MKKAEWYQYFSATISIALFVLLWAILVLAVAQRPSTSALPWDMVVGTAATIIALLALFASIRQEQSTRLHNRLSVKPILGFEIEAIGEPDLGLKLVNKGVGPAIIREFSIYVEGKLMDKEGSGGWDAAFTDLGYEEKQLEFGWWESNQTMRAEDELELLGYFGKEPAKRPPLQERRCILHDILSKINIKIAYVSVYEESELTWLDLKEKYPHGFGVMIMANRRKAPTTATAPIP